MGLARGRLVPLRGGHNDNFLMDADTYQAALRNFLSGLRSA
jgi:hypothetical protein